MTNARIIEKDALSTVATSESIPSVDLNKASKFSIQVVAVVGDCIAHLEGSNDNVTFTELDSGSVAEGASVMFEQPNCAYRYARITIENDDVVDVSADSVILVMGDSI